jgi:hypothetical protein
MKRLTGNFYFNPTLFGLILMVEHESVPDPNDKDDKYVPYKEFSRASTADAFELGLISSPKMQVSP